MIWYDRRL